MDSETWVVPFTITNIQFSYGPETTTSLELLLFIEAGTAQEATAAAEGYAQTLNGYFGTEAGSNTITIGTPETFG